MKRFISYGSIDTFENKMYDLKRNVQYIGQDDNNEPIFDENKKMPTINCIASEKIHGTNASVAYSNKDGFWVQSKKRILTPEEDNFGTAKTAMENEIEWLNIINELAKEYNIDLNKNIIVIYFEWSGSSIQGRCALSGIEGKKAVIFQHFKVAQMEPAYDVNNEETSNYFLPTKVNNTWVENKDYGILNIMNNKQWEFSVDLSSPKKDFDKIMDIVLNEIEPNSPFGCALGKENNIGEGVVLTFDFDGNIHRMKVKGDKHTKSKVKVQRVLSPEEEVLLKKVEDFVINKACTEGRLEQGYLEVMHVEGLPLVGDMKKIGQFMKWLGNDVIKEETRAMEEAGLVKQDIGKMVSAIGSKWVKERISSDLL